MTAAGCTVDLLGTACASTQTALCCDGATVVSTFEFPPVWIIIGTLRWLMLHFLRRLISRSSSWAAPLFKESWDPKQTGFQRGDAPRLCIPEPFRLSGCQLEVSGLELDREMDNNTPLQCFD